MTATLSRRREAAGWGKWIGYLRPAVPAISDSEGDQVFGPSFTFTFTSTLAAVPDSGVPVTLMT